MKYTGIAYHLGGHQHARPCFQEPHIPGQSKRHFATKSAINQLLSTYQRASQVFVFVTDSPSLLLELCFGSAYRQPSGSEFPFTLPPRPMYLKIRSVDPQFLQIFFVNRLNKFSHIDAQDQFFFVREKFYTCFYLSFLKCLHVYKL